jgi:general secretion pathway protein K
MAISVSRRSSQRGSALLIVLWLGAALAAVGIAVASTVRAETERTATNVDDAKAYFLARGAIEQAALRMFWSSMYAGPDGQPLYYRAGTPTMELTFPAGLVHIDIVPETAKLNLNISPPADLQRLLLALGIAPDQAAQITAAIVDWRSPADLLRPSPFDAFYSSLQPSFSARHASFRENEELLLVQGITPDIYYGASLKGDRNALRDCVSVFGSTGAVDINSAQPATLLAVGLAPSDADAIVKLRATHPVVDYNEFGNIARSLGPAASRLMIGGRTMYTLRATARVRTPDGKLSDLRRTAAALVKMDYMNNLERRAPGIEVMRWYDRP